jgi:hypothetical protein
MPDRTFSIAQDVQPVHGRGPSETWAYVDRAGHVHSYVKPAEEGESCYPTLVARSGHVPCPNPEGCGCDGYADEWWECALCGERIRPATRSVTYYQHLDTRYSVDSVPVTAEEYGRLLAEHLATMPPAGGPNPPEPKP